MTAPAAWAATDDSALWPLYALDRRLQQAVEQFREAANAELQADPLRGLYISEAEVNDLLERGAGSGREPSTHRLTTITERLLLLEQRFGLDRPDLDLLLICLAPDLSSRYQRLYAYLQDDATRRRPTVELVERLLERDAVGSTMHLLRSGILIADADERSTPSSLLVSALRLDEHIVDYLCGSDALDRRLRGWATLLEPLQNAVDFAVHPAEVAQLTRLLGSRTGDGPSIVSVRGQGASGPLLAVRIACAAAHRSILVADLAALLPTLQMPLEEEPFQAVVREARLHDAVLVWRGLDAPGAERSDAPVKRLLGHCLTDHVHPTVLLGDPRSDSAGLGLDGQLVSIDLAPIDAATRTLLWARHLDERFTAAAASELGQRYHLVEDEAMRAVVASAAWRASVRNSTAVELNELIEAARAVASPPMHGLATRVEPRFSWDDLVLPADALARLRELCARQRFRATVFETWRIDPAHSVRDGIAALFVGQPGTGKSMAAEVIAADLGYDVCRVDLSAVVSKYIGETEKNLESIFRAAELGEGVLLFDEADALFGKRSEVRDAHDRYANMEVAYLLQRLERYRGVVILTSNLNGNLDDAFMRRLDAVIEFSLPGEGERRELWQRCLPETVPRSDDVDFPMLARAFKLSGGDIRNTSVTAAFLAAADGEPVRLQHVLWAIRREYQKLGKLAADTEFDALTVAHSV